MKVQARDQAFSLFCKGKTLAEAAEAVGVHRSTTERWSREFHWKIHRERTWNEQREQAIKDRAQKFVFDERELINRLFNLMQEASAQFDAYRLGKLPKRAMKYSLRDFLAIARAYVDVEDAVVHRQAGEIEHDTCE